ncbi:MAG: RNA polymerase sigma factor [Pirellulales bacterium]|nr:RNA polymerase sigma factor [Pirellulales bacterium]
MTDQLTEADPRNAVVADLGDRALLTDFCESGNEAAFRAIVARHAPMVSSVCTAVLGNRADAEDAFQAAFFVLARKASKISRKESLVGWLHRVALRCALTARRRRKKQVTVELPPPDIFGDGELEKISSRAMIQALHEELDRLPHGYRIPLILYYLQGEDYGAISQRMKLSEAATRKRVQRGREMLRRRMGMLGFAGLAVAGLCKLAVATGSRSVSTILLQSTVSIATQVRAAWSQGLMAVTGQKTSLALAQGVLKTMMISTLTKTTLAIFSGTLAGLIAMTSIAIAQEATADSSPDPTIITADLAVADETQPTGEIAASVSTQQAASGDLKINWLSDWMEFAPVNSEQTQSGELSWNNELHFKGRNAQQWNEQVHGWVEMAPQPKQRHLDAANTLEQT